MFSNRLRVYVIVAVLALAGSTAHASPIVFNPGPGSTPDITSSVAISYTAGTGLLTITGSAVTVRVPAGQGVSPQNIQSGVFSLTAYVTTAGALDTTPAKLALDKMTITGGDSQHQVANVNSPIPTTTNYTAINPSPCSGAIVNSPTCLFAGNISNFSFIPFDPINNVAAVLEFLVNVTSDPFSLGFGSLAGVLVPTGNVTALNMLSSFSGNSSSTDTFGHQTLTSVPEPASLVLLGTGAAIMLLRKRLSRKRSVS